jgi:hypothetical protein
MSDEHGAESAGEGRSEPARPRETAPSAEPKPVRRSAAAWLVLVLLLLVAVIAASPWWAPPLAPLLPWGGASEGADTAARARLATLDLRLTALEQRRPAAPGDALQGALDKTNERLTALEEKVGQGSQDSDLAAVREAVQRVATAQSQLADRVAALDGKLGERPALDPAALTALQESVEKLRADLAALDIRVGTVAAAESAAGERGDARNAGALLVALGQLREALAGSAPFSDTLAGAAALAKDRPDVKAALDRLSPVAAGGIPSLAVLRERFERIAGTLANAEATRSAEWSDRILGAIRSALGARRVGAGAVEGGPEAAVATAEGALDSGDLAGAVAAVETLQGAAADTAKPWLEAARRRLDAEGALASASAAVTADLAPDAGMKPPKQP